MEKHQWTGQPAAYTGAAPRCRGPGRSPKDPGTDAFAVRFSGVMPVDVFEPETCSSPRGLGTWRMRWRTRADLWERGSKVRCSGSRPRTSRAVSARVPKDDQRLGRRQAQRRVPAPAALFSATVALSSYRRWRNHLYPGIPYANRGEVRARRTANGHFDAYESERVRSKDYLWTVWKLATDPKYGVR